MKKLFFGFFLTLSFFIVFNSASADTLGQKETFFVSQEYEVQSRPSVSSTLKKVSINAYFYVEDGYWDILANEQRIKLLEQINKLANEFDNRIYPVERDFFGSEPSPGIDNDPKLTILLTRLSDNAGGYFDTGNEFSKSEYAMSNEREMIYLNLTFISEQNKMYAFLAHEFQHLITFNQKDKLADVKDDIWLNELRSEYAVSLLGYNYDNNITVKNLEKRASSFIQDPSDSLTEWKNQPSDYAQVGIFGEYLAEQFSPKIIADTTKNNLVGIHSINDALIKNGFNDSFVYVYANWLVANILNDETKNKKFGYTAEVLNNFRVAPTRGFTNLSDNNSFIVSEQFKDWQAHWYDFSNFSQSGNKVMRIKFSSPSLTSFYISYLVFDSSGGVKLKFFVPDEKSDTLYVDNIGVDINRVIVMPIKKDKFSGFSSNETPVVLTFLADRINSVPNLITSSVSPSAIIESPSKINNQQSKIADGSLIRASGDYKVYIVKGNFIRHIKSSKIFSFYTGLGFDKVTIVSPDVLNQYKESNLIRYEKDVKVYLIDNESNRHWLDVTPEKFITMGLDWGSIYVVNLLELTFYKKSFNIINTTVL